MRFTETALQGVFLIDLERHVDERGFFARLFCEREFEAHGLNASVAQAAVAFNERRGTLRGLHFQHPPAADTKLVRCSRGAMFDVVVDLRPESTTYLQHIAVELTEDAGRSVYVPERCAHGYQSLEDGTEVVYLMGALHAPDAEGGLLYSDPRLAIAWPLPVTVISARDRAWPPLADAGPELSSRMGACTIEE